MKGWMYGEIEKKKKDMEEWAKWPQIKNTERNGLVLVGGKKLRKAFFGH